MNKNIIFIGGINGAGKSTVAKRLSEELSIPFYEGSKCLMNELGIINDDYESLRKANEAQKKKALYDVFQKINLKNSDKKAIITGHFVKIIDGRITKYEGRWFNFCFCLIHISSKPEIILKRIDKDHQERLKKRSLFAKNKDRGLFLKNAQIKSIKCLQGIVKKYKVRGININNDDEINNTIKYICENVNFDVSQTEK